MTSIPGAEALATLRCEIDALDDKLVALLARRFACLDRVVAVKTREQLPALIPERVEEVVERVCVKARAAGMPADFAEAVWRTIIEQSIAFELSHLARNGADDNAKGDATDAR